MKQETCALESLSRKQGLVIVVVPNELHSRKHSETRFAKFVMFFFFFGVFSLQLAFSFPMVLLIDTCSGGYDPCTSLSEVSRPPFLNTFVDKPLVCGIQEWIACRTSRAACFPPLFLQGCSRNCNSICMPFFFSYTCHRFQQEILGMQPSFPASMSVPS